MNKKHLELISELSLSKQVVHWLSTSIYTEMNKQSILCDELDAHGNQSRKHTRYKERKQWPKLGQTSGTYPRSTSCTKPSDPTCLRLNQAMRPVRLLTRNDDLGSQSWPGSLFTSPQTSPYSTQTSLKVGGQKVTIENTEGYVRCPVGWCRGAWVAQHTKIRPRLSLTPSQIPTADHVSSAEHVSWVLLFLTVPHKMDESGKGSRARPQTARYHPSSPQPGAWRSHHGRRPWRWPKSPSDF